MSKKFYFNKMPNQTTLGGKEFGTVGVLGTTQSVAAKALRHAIPGLESIAVCENGAFPSALQMIVGKFCIPGVLFRSTNFAPWA